MDESNGSLSPERIQQLIGAGWWKSTDNRWFGPEQHPNPAHRAHFASVAVAAQSPEQAAPQQFGSGPATNPPAVMAYSDDQHGQGVPAQQPVQMSPLAQQMAEDARRKAAPPEPEALEPEGEIEEWRRTVRDNAAAMDANAPKRRRFGSGKRAQRRSLLPFSALCFAIAALVAFAYYVPSVRTTFLETKAQITGEPLPVEVQPAPVGG